jgi:hypothetical protein
VTTIERLVTNWVRLYTAGLAPDERAERRAEIASDLWEQRAAMRDAGESGGRTALAIGGRWLAGIPDDLAWRAARRSSRNEPDRQRERSPSVNGLGSIRSLAAPLALAVVAVAVAGVLVVIDNIQYVQQRDSIIPTAILTSVWLGMLIGGLTATTVGFLIMARRPGAGAIIASGGALTAAVVTYWLIVPLVVAGLLSWYAVRRARRLAAEGAS